MNDIKQIWMIMFGKFNFILHLSIRRIKTILIMIFFLGGGGILFNIKGKEAIGLN